jgi:hypothetical protein
MTARAHDLDRQPSSSSPIVTELFLRAWPVALIGMGLTLTGVWMTLLGYALYSIADVAF